MFIRIGFLVLSVFTVEKSPIIFVVILVAEVLEKGTEQVLDVLVVWLVLEVEGSAVLHVGDELRWETLAEFFKVGHDLLLLDLLVLFLDSSGSKSLPREFSSQEVHEDVSETFHVVSSGLFDTDVSVDTGISGGTCEGFSVLVLDVLSIGRHELLGETEIDDENSVGVLSSSDGEVIRLDISVDDSSGVDVLDSLDHLLGNHENCLQGELSGAVVEEVFEGSSEEVHDHQVVLALGSVVENLWDGLTDDG